MRSTLRILAAVVLVPLVLAVAACGDRTPSAVPTVASSVLPTTVPLPSVTPSATPDPTPTRTPTQAPSVAPSTAPVLAPGATGDLVRDLQARLLQLGWFAAPVTGTYDARTAEAVRGFQAKRRLPATGVLDQATWVRVREMSNTPSYDELHNIVPVLGPGSKGDRVRDLQARLAQISWYAGNVDGLYGASTEAAVRGFQAKRGLPVTGTVNQATLDRLYAMTRLPTYAELHNVLSPTGLDPRCLTGRAMCISKTTRKLVWVVDGVPLLRLDVRFGAVATPTREGSFRVEAKARTFWSTLYQSDMPFAMFFSGGQAVHYSSDFAARGYYGASHGCVNVRDWDGIAWLFDRVRIGDKVIVYW